MNATLAQIELALRRAVSAPPYSPDRRFVPRLIDARLAAKKSPKGVAFIAC